MAGAGEEDSELTGGLSILRQSEEDMIWRQLAIWVWTSAVQ